MPRSPICSRGCGELSGAGQKMRAAGEHGNEERQPSTPIDLPQPIFQIDTNYRVAFAAS